MICFSGARIEPKEQFPQFDGIPTLTDIALGLGRMPRFAGQTRRSWTGLHHSFVCMEIAARLYPNNERIQFLCLMHDAHEAVTGDAPAHFKAPLLSIWQDEIDTRLYKHLGVWPITKEEHEAVKRVDGLALRAEGEVVGPPMIMSHLNDVDPAFLSIVSGILDEYPSPLDTDGLDSPAAKDFYACVATLIGRAVHDRRDDTPQGGRTNPKEDS